MQQVLFHIPVLGIPIYGYGAMLFVAFIVCSWLTGWRAEKEGVPRTYVHDVIIWLFLGGIFGARVTYMIQYQVPLSQFFVIWKGGLVFYGSFFGGVISYGVWRAVQEGRDVLVENRARLTRWVVGGLVIGLICVAAKAAFAQPAGAEDEPMLQALRRVTFEGAAFGAALGGLVGFSFAYILVVQKHAPLNWKFMDIMTPSLALGLALGRVGCLLNGCCFGNVACTTLPGDSLPPLRPRPIDLHGDGLSDGGRLHGEEGGGDLRTLVGIVEPKPSPAAEAGLEAGDRSSPSTGSRIPSSWTSERAARTRRPAWSALLSFLGQDVPGRTFTRLEPGRIRVYYEKPTNQQDLDRSAHPNSWARSR